MHSANRGLQCEAIWREKNPVMWTVHRHLIFRCFFFFFSGKAMTPFSKHKTYALRPIFSTCFFFLFARTPHAKLKRTFKALRICFLVLIKNTQVTRYHHPPIMASFASNTRNSWRALQLPPAMRKKCVQRVEASNWPFSHFWEYLGAATRKFRETFLMPLRSGLLHIYSSTTSLFFLFRVLYVPVFLLFQNAGYIKMNVDFSL